METTTGNMTREEAITAVAEAGRATSCNNELRSAAVLVVEFEALCLLKFDEVSALGGNISDATPEPPRFAAGDLVRLRSGGPVMAVLRRLSNQRIDVDWFVDGALFRDVFDPKELDFAHLVKASDPMRPLEALAASLRLVMDRSHCMTAAAVNAELEAHGFKIVKA
jgi:uncharacterized protein YodC (DUF2158 family)